MYENKIKTLTNFSEESYGKLNKQESKREKTNYNIIKMIPEHIVQAAAIEAEVFSVPWTARGFADALGLDYTLFYAACVDSILVGYCGIYLAADEGEITNVAVSYKYRRHGIAQALVQHTLLQAHSKGSQRIFLEVRSSNEPAISLYTKLGFHVKGKRKNFYQSPLEDALVMMYEYADK